MESDGSTDTSGPERFERGEMVVFELPCVQCSYTLVGCRTGDPCPECGTPIDRTYRPDLFLFQPDGAVQRASRGIGALKYSILLNVLIVLIFGVVGAILGSSGGGQGTPGLAQDARLLALLGVVTNTTGFGLTIWMLTGWLRVASQHHDDRFFYEYQSAANATRVGAWIVVVVGGIGLVLAIIGVVTGASIPAADGTLSPLGGLLALLSIPLALVAFVGNCLVFFGGLLVLRQIALRSAQPKLAKKAGRYMWLLPVIGVVGIILLFLGPLIALVMYYNLLDKIKKGVDAVRKMRPASG